MSGAPLWLRLFIGGASRIAPGPVARLANAVYRRPSIARRFDTGDRNLLTVAEGILNAAEATDTPTSCGIVRSYWFGPRENWRGLVLLLHGWTVDSRAMAAFAEPLATRGYAAIAIDLPAHGDSYGDQTDAKEGADAVIEVLNALELRPDHFIGHSYGGGVAGVLADMSLVPQRFACLASPSALATITDDFCAAFSLSQKCRLRFEALVEADLGCKISDLDALRIWPDKQTRILLLHAPDDAEVAFADAERNSALPNAELAPMPGLGHRRIVHDDLSVGRAIDFITDAPLDASPPQA